MGKCNCGCFDSNITLPVGLPGPTGAQGIAGIHGTNGIDGINAPQWSFGTTDPMFTPTSDPAFYCNTTTYDIWSYVGGNWTKKVNGYDDWQSVTTYNNTYTNDASNPIKYRIEGYNCRIKGVTFNTDPSPLTSASLVFTLPLAYRPTEARYIPVIDLFGTGVVTCLLIQPNGNVIINASSSLPSHTNTVYLDVCFPIIK